MTIYFYTATDQYGCFSNFSLHRFFLDGYQWPSVEHYFQAQKFFGIPYRDVIRRAKNPKEASVLGKTRKYKLRADWDQVKDELMYKAVKTKFKTHSDIRAILLGTIDEEIVENSPYDYYWGCGQDGNGQNRLGKILMRVREELGQANGHSIY